MLGSPFTKAVEIDRETVKLKVEIGKKVISESISREGGEFEWPTKIVLTAGANAKSNRAKASPKEAKRTAVMVAAMLARLLQASANVNTRAASRPLRMAGLHPSSAHTVNERSHV
jgi:hypothetical protein